MSNLTTSTPVIVGDSATNGTWLHTGRFTVSCRLASGAVVTVQLPDDWQTLLARVALLKTKVAAMPNSLEDLTYAG